MDGITLATAVIAGFTVVLCLLQWWQIRHNRSVARANYKLALFDKRMTVYVAIMAFLGDFVREGRTELHSAVKMIRDTRTARYLFPADCTAYIDELYRKSIEYQRAYTEWDSLRGRAADLDQEGLERKEQWLQRMHGYEDWFMEQINQDRVETILGTHLKLPVTV